MLVADKQLLLVEGIDVAEDLAGVDYVHFLFNDHQVVWSNGAETESLHPGRNALDMAGGAGREEIFAIFPELRNETVTRAPARLPACPPRGPNGMHAGNAARPEPYAAGFLIPPVTKGKDRLRRSFFRGGQLSLRLTRKGSGATGIPSSTSFRASSSFASP